MENSGLTVVIDFVDELYKAGVRHVCVSPGSRSTPLTMTFARHGAFTVWSQLDERSAGFFALGLARRSRTAVVLVCTSGTATGNYLPAVMEASESRVPLIVLTADRPPELHGVGANQTVDQWNLYGSAVKWFCQMPVPEDTPVLHRQARASAWRAVAMALQAPHGPVHLNWPFREPLVPVRVNRDTTSTEPTVGGLMSFALSQGTVSEESIGMLGELMAGSHRPLCVCGPQDDAQLASLIASLGEAYGMPILADPLSQLRSSTSKNVITAYDIFLRDERIRNRVRPDFILRIGRTPTSKALGQFLEGLVGTRFVVVDESPKWHDPFHIATDVVIGSPKAVCSQLLLRRGQEGSDVEQRTDSRNSNGSSVEVAANDTEWLLDWAEMEEKAETTMHALRETEYTYQSGAMDGSKLGASVEGIGSDTFSADSSGLFEGWIFPELCELLPPFSMLFAGNSMPVRDMDSFLTRAPQGLYTSANRGVSGIDGVVSTALGMAAVHRDGPAVLVIGDVSFYHDLNGLLVALRHGINLLVVLVHNDGGGIFSFLPQKAHVDTFGHFRTQHGMNFRSIVEAYGGRFVQARSWSGFRELVKSMMAEPGVNVVEIRTDPDDNVTRHNSVFSKVMMSVYSEQG